MKKLHVDFGSVAYGHSSLTRRSGHTAANSPPAPLVLLGGKSNAKLLTTSVGSLSYRTDFTMINMPAANVVIFPKCSTRTLKEWIDDLAGDDMGFYLDRPSFVADVGIALMRTREAQGIRRSELSETTGLSRTTIYQIEGGHSIGGSSLGMVRKYLSGCRGASIAFTFAEYDGAPISKELFSATVDPIRFSATLVRGMRKSANLTQAELGHLVRLPAAMEKQNFDRNAYLGKVPSSAPQLSMIERLDGKQGQPRRSLRLGTLFTIAYFCGIKMGVSIPEAPTV